MVSISYSRFLREISLKQEQTSVELYARKSVSSVLGCGAVPYMVRRWSVLLGSILLAFAMFAAPQHCRAEAGPLPSVPTEISPITLHDAARLNLAASIPDPAIIPTDETPTHIGEERQLLSSPMKLMLLERLPARMYFNAVTELTQRFESNVFSTASQPRREYAMRVLPNVTLGYYVLPKTSVYANYFVIKDVFAHTPILNQSTFQSVGGGVQHEFTLGKKINGQLNFQFRELFQAKRFRQADLLPGVTLTRAFTPRFIGFFNTQLQMRSRNLFQGAQREIDPFYTLGAVYRRGNWTFTSTATLVNSFRNNRAIPPQTNMTVICDFELSRPLSRKHLPGLDVFVRAEPIWNWQGKSQPGLSGFDFRIFGGLRASIVKPAVYSQLQYLRKQLREEQP